MTNSNTRDATDTPEPTDRERERQAITDDVAYLCGRISACPNVPTADLRRIQTRLTRIIRDFSMGGVSHE